MHFGIFDHMDRSGEQLAVQYENRLTMLEACDRAGFTAITSPSITRRRWLRTVAERVSRRRRAAHQEHPPRRAGVHAEPLSSAPHSRRNLHARSFEQRPARAGSRPRHLADRGELLWCRCRKIAGDLWRSRRDPAAGPDVERHQFRRQALHLQRRPGRVDAAAEAYSVVVRRGAARERRPCREGCRQISFATARPKW